MRVILDGMDAGMSIQKMTGVVLAETTQLNRRVNGSRFHEALLDMRDGEEGVAEVEYTQNAQSLILDLLAQKMAESAPEAPLHKQVPVHQMAR